ncbi:MAG: hypothetical protein AAGL89_08920 [Pseudomonadota bacterium]
MLALFSACAERPDLPRRGDAANPGDFPAFVPVAGLIDQAQAETGFDTDGPVGLDARLAALRARAAALRGPVITATDRARLRQDLR